MSPVEAPLRWMSSKCLWQHSPEKKSFERFKLNHEWKWRVGRFGACIDGGTASASLRYM